MLIQQVEKAGTLTFRIVAQGDIHQRNIKKYREDEAAYMARERIWAAKMRDWRSRKKADPPLDAPRPKPPRAPRYIARPKQYAIRNTQYAPRSARYTLRERRWRLRRENPVR